MDKVIKITIITSVIVSVSVSFVSAWLVGNQSARFGATTDLSRFNKSAIATRGINISTTMPASVVDNTLTVAGTSSLATSTVSGTLVVTGASTSTKAKFTGRVSVGTSTDSTNTYLYVGGTTTQISTAYTPAATSTACALGSIAYDANYIYFCSAANFWKRATGSEF